MASFDYARMFFRRILLQRLRSIRRVSLLGLRLIFTFPIQDQIVLMCSQWCWMSVVKSVPLLAFILGRLFLWRILIPKAHKCTSILDSFGEAIIKSVFPISWIHCSRSVWSTYSNIICIFSEEALFLMKMQTSILLLYFEEMNESGKIYFHQIYRLL